MIYDIICVVKRYFYNKTLKPEFDLNVSNGSGKSGLINADKKATITFDDDEVIQGTGNNNGQLFGDYRIQRFWLDYFLWNSF